MNLNKAKTILIYAFLGLNLFLAYHLFGIYAAWPGVNAFSIEQLRYVKERLALNNYFLDAPVDRSMRKSAFLTVAPSLVGQTEILNRITFSDIYQADDDSLVYVKPGMQARFYKSGLIQISYQPGKLLEEGCTDMDTQDLLNIVGQFLQAENLMPEQAHFDYKEKAVEGPLLLHYYQSYNDNMLFAGYLKVTIEGDRITAVELFFLEPLEWSLEREMEVIPVTEALLRLADELGPSPKPRRIVKAELGLFSREYNAEKWEVPPVWRFLTDDGDSIFINAFTGNLEMD